MAAKEMGTASRYAELDMARGAAVLMMVAYHILFDLTYPNNSSFYFLAIAAAASFIMVSGISLHISYSRGARFFRFLKRSVVFILLGEAITLLSYLYLSGGFIDFGILHFFGLSSVLVYPFLRKSGSEAVLFAAIATFIIGLYASSQSFNGNILLWTGITPLYYSSFDFVPVFPWIGAMLVGVYLGNLLYPGGKRGFAHPRSFRPGNTGTVGRMMGFFGRNSLAIYLLHQPVIILILYLAGAGAAPGIIGLV